MIFIFLYNKFISHNYQNSSNVCFSLFNFLWEEVGVKILQRKHFPPKLRSPCRHSSERYISLLIEFPIEQVIREFPVSDITYLSSNRKGQWLRYPGLGSLHPTPGNLANSHLNSYLIILNLKFSCTDIIMVVEPAFTYFFTLREGIGAKILWSISFLPSLENLVNKIKVQNVFFVFLKQFLI